MLGTKCPSMTSRWIQSAPAASTARTSSPNLAKSEARIEGAITRGRGANCRDMCAFSENYIRAYGWLRVSRAKPGGNADKSARREAENSAATASIAGGERANRDTETPSFIGYFKVARRLLIPGPGK